MKTLNPTRNAPTCDDIAQHLMRMGKMAKAMPPSFDSHGVSHRAAGMENCDLGRMLPGHGFIAARDLKNFGITRQLPNVYDPSEYRHIEDATRRRLSRSGLVAIQGASITTYDQIIAARGAGNANDIAFVKTSLTTVANNWSTLWHTGGSPAAGTYLATTAPTDEAGTSLDAQHPAGIAISAFLSNPAGSARKYLLTFGFTAVQQINMAVLADLQNTGGSFRLSVNTAETVASPTNATRQYGSGSGVGNLLSLIVATAGTPGAGSLTVQYVNQAGSATNAPALTMAAVACVADTVFTSGASFTAANQTGLFIPLASGDTGVQAVKQTTAAVAGTGVLATQVWFPLLFLPGLAGNAYIERDSTAQIDGMTELVNVSQVIGHLTMFVLTNTTSTGVLAGYLKTVAG